MTPLHRIIPLLLACPLLALAACDPEADAAPRSRLAEHRALAEAHAQGRALDRLAAARQLLVDPRIEVETDQVRVVLLPGTLAHEPTTLADLRSAPELRGASLRETLLGGQDARRPAIFDDVAVGTYTACVVVGPPRDPATTALIDHAAALYEADSGGPELSAERLMAATARARAETGLVPQKIVWNDQPLICQRIDVTADPASRAATFDDV